MTIIRTSITDDRQLYGPGSIREQVVGGSERAALVGAHPFLSRFGLFLLKTGRLQPEDETGPMRRGRKLEPVAIDLIKDDHPTWQFETERLYFHDPERRLGATPDLLVVDPERGPGAIQIKSVAPSVFREKWRDADGTVTPPPGVVIQAIGDADLSGGRWAAVAALVIDHSIDLHLIDVPMHAGILAAIDAEAAAFWREVAEDRPPDPDYGRDAALIARLYPRDSGSEIDLSADNELPAVIARRDQIAEQRRDLDFEYRSINARLLHRIGDNTLARLAGGIVVTAKTVNVKAHAVAASSYRSIRVVQPRA